MLCALIGFRYISQGFQYADPQVLEALSAKGDEEAGDTDDQTSTARSVYSPLVNDEDE